MRWSTHYLRDNYMEEQNTITPQWLEWAQRLQAIAQNGLAYSENQFDIERYHSLQNITAEIVSPIRS